MVMSRTIMRCLTHVESAPLAVTMESTKTRGSQQGAALMKRTTKYVALDVHQATTVASVREESGRVIARSVLPTDRKSHTSELQSQSNLVCRLLLEKKKKKKI